MQNVVNGAFSYPSLSPNRDLIIAQSKVGSFIQLFRIDAGKAQQLTTDSANHSHPALSLGGDWIAYTKEAEGQRDIFLLHAGTKEAYNLTRTPAFNESHPSWGRADSVIIYNTNRYDSLQEIAVITLHNGVIDRLTADKEEDTYGSLSTDGSRLLFTKWLDKEKNPEVYVLSLVDGSETRITNNQHRDVAPVWLSDTVISYTQTGTIIIHNIITGDQKRLTSDSGYSFGRGVKVSYNSLLCERTRERKPEGLSIIRF